MGITTLGPVSFLAILMFIKVELSDILSVSVVGTPRKRTLSILGADVQFFLTTKNAYEVLSIAPCN